MKYYIFIISILCGMLVHAQEKTISQSELDSLSNKSDSKVLHVIENVPIYKGCKREDGNANKKKCMSQKIARLFHNEFNTTLPKGSEIEAGLKRIVVIFKVGKDGKVIDIDSNAEDEFLKDEAKRVAQMIPQMTPGMQRGEPVIVPYALPLLVEMTKDTDEDLRYPIYRGCDKEPTNAELETCSKRKITNFIKMSFDIEMASRALPLVRSTQFLLEFTISKNGKIKNINAKANHKAIAIEAINVAKRLPKFKAPGLWEGVAVDTPFSLLMTLDFL
nr:hypothetical protein [uncultured Psychroserpens sp.]